MDNVHDPQFLPTLAHRPGTPIGAPSSCGLDVHETTYYEAETVPDPNINGGIRIQAVFGHQSGLPEDRMVNTFAAFRNIAETTFESASDALATALEGFYCEAQAPGTVPLMGWMSNALDALEYRFYDLNQAPPRAPYIVPSALFSPSSSAPLPEEVATVLSFVCERNLPRQRGRIYVGPLTTGTLSEVDDEPRPFSGTLNSLEGAGQHLVDWNALNGADTAWFGIISQVDGVIREITGGWVDNAFDTQRRRGLAATARQTYGTFTS